MGLQIVKPDTHIDFIGFRRIAYVASLLVILVGVASLVMKGGPRYGIDFAGGMVVQLKFDKASDVGTIKAALEKAEMPGLVVQSFGDEGDNEVLLRTSESEKPSDQVRREIAGAFEANLPDMKYEIQRLEAVGPKVGADLRSKALEAMFYAVLLIAIYVSGRFEQRWMAAAIMAGGLSLSVYLLGLLGVPMSWLIIVATLLSFGICWWLKLNFALGAIIAMVHDVAVTIGLFSLLDKEIDLTVIAALLTIIGYSLNDTIIVFDRIRENINADRNRSFGRIINESVNQTLSRTILTSGTTLLVVVALYFFGGGVIHDFALALLVGIAAGTYSSIYVASPILMGFGPSAALLEQEAKDGAKA